MSTIQDLENAPIGATASSAETNARYVKSSDRWLLFDGRGDWWVDEYGLESEGFELDPALTAPTTVQEALDLAWNLAHPVKEGQHIPEGTRLLDRSGHIDLSAYATQATITINARESLTIRTHEPLPDPEPDWLDAPAVLAAMNDCSWQKVWLPKSDGNWECTCCGVSRHWSKMADVTPLYPKDNA